MGLLSFLTGKPANTATTTQVVMAPLDSTQAGPGQLPAVTLPRPPSRSVALPSFKTQVDRLETPIQRRDRNLHNVDIVNYRSGATQNDVMRDLAASSPDLSGTRNSYIRVGIPERYTILAREMDGTISREGTQLAQEILRRITFLGDNTLGYNPITDLQSLSESLAMELTTYGGIGLELALDKTRAPAWITPVSITKIKWKEEEGGVYPIQELGGEEISLDIPTFFYVSVDQDLLTPYATSMFESAVQAVLADAQFLNDLRRAMMRSIQPRIIAKIIEEKVEKSIDDETRMDPVKHAAFYGNLITSLSEKISGLQPDDAIVVFDSVEVSMMSGSDRVDIGQTLTAVQKLLESKLAAGAKSNSAVLGRADNGTTATTSTMLFVKNADVIRRKLNTLYSRMLTQACRLYGNDVFVEFRYDDIDLRPQAELEAYKAMKQSRIMEQWSMGLLTDEEAGIELTGHLPPDGMIPRSGTMFHQAKAPVENPDSQTSTMNGQKDNLKPNTPAAPKD